MNIDIVYLWVDGGDKKWRKQRDFWYDKINHRTIKTYLAQRPVQR